MSRGIEVSSGTGKAALLATALMFLFSSANGIVLYRLYVENLPMIDVGIWVLFASIGGYVLYLDLGVSPTLARVIAFSRAHPNVARGRLRVERYCFVVLRVYIFMAAAAILLGMALGALLLRRMGFLNSYYLGSLALFLLGSCLNLLASPFLAILFGHGNVAYDKGVRAFGILVWFSCAVTALTAGFGLIGLSVAWIMQFIVVLSAAVLGAYRKINLGRLERSFEGSRRRLMGLYFAKLAIPSAKWAVNAIGALLVLQISSMVAGIVLGAEIVPIVDAPMKIGLLLTNFSNIVFTAFLPLFSRYSAIGDKEAFSILLYSAMRTCLRLSWVGLLGYYYFAPFLFPLWLGDGVEINYQVVLLLCFWMALEVHNIGLSSAVMAAGHIVFHISTLASGLISVTFSLLLAFKIGVVGVILGPMLGQVLTNVWYIPHVAKRTIGLDLPHYLRNVVLPALLFAGVAFLCLNGSSAIPGRAVATPAVFAMLVGYALFASRADLRFLLNRKVDA